MGFKIPVLNQDSDEFKRKFYAKVTEPVLQKRLVLVIVSTALLLDNMLYMVIVPIIPIYLRDIGAYKTNWEEEVIQFPNGTSYTQRNLNYIGEDEALGFLFASKAMVQIFINPLSGTLIDRFGYEYPMIFGLTVMFFSTSVFAVGQSYGILFFARSLQGLGSAFADTSGMAMIADRFTEEHERSKALGIALAFISFGSLIAPPYGSFLFEFAGKSVPFIILALVCFADAVAVFAVIMPNERRNTESGEPLQGTPIWRLFLDPYIAAVSGALVMANVSLAFLEPTISRWMKDEMPDVTEWEIGLIWLPAFFPHVAGVYATVVLMRRFPQYPWAMAAGGLAMEGLACFIVPFANSFWVLAFPLAIICFGIALIDTSLLPMLGYLVDTRHTPVYGSIYAIADISYSLAYAVGPIIAGEVVANMGFTALNVGICISNLAYAPVITLLRKVYVYKPFEEDALMDDNGAYGRFDDDANAGGYETVSNPNAKMYGAVDNGVANSDGYGYGGNFEYQGGFGVPQQTYPQPGADR